YSRYSRQLGKLLWTPRGLRTELYGRFGAGPSQRSQSRPGSSFSPGRSHHLLGPPTLTYTALSLPTWPLRTSWQARRNVSSGRWLAGALPFSPGAAPGTISGAAAAAAAPRTKSRREIPGPSLLMLAPRGRGPTDAGRGPTRAPRPRSGYAGRGGMQTRPWGTF